MPYKLLVFAFMFLCVGCKKEDQAKHQVGFYLAEDKIDDCTGKLLKQIDKEELYCITGQPIVSGDSIQSAVPNRDWMGLYQLSIRLDKVGEEELFLVTKENVGKMMVVLVDDRIIFAAKISSALRGNFSITGLQDEKEAEELAEQLAGRSFWGW